MNIGRLLTTGLLATTLHAGACKKAAPHIVSADAGHIGKVAEKISSDARKITERSARDITIDECVERESKHLTGEKLFRHEGFMVFYGCQRKINCEKINYKTMGCKAFMPAR